MIGGDGRVQGTESADDEPIDEDEGAGVERDAGFAVRGAARGRAVRRFVRGRRREGMERATLIARGRISVQHALANEGAEVAVPMYDKLERATSPATVHVALRTRDVAETRASKRIFYVRHGESKWNEAQRDINIANMMRFDHPLTLVGVQQAQALGRTRRGGVFARAGGRVGARQRDEYFAADDEPAVFAVVAEMSIAVVDGRGKRRFRSCANRTGVARRATFRR